MMFEVLEKKMVVPNLHLLRISAPEIVEQIKPGQFVIVRSDKDSERIPMSVADWDTEDGSLTIIFMEVGRSTGKLAELRQGDSIPTVVGPLGKPTEIENFGTVLCIGGCYGIGSLFPVIRGLKQKGNDVIAVMEARSHYLLYWEDKIKPFCSRLVSITRDGSRGSKGHVNKINEIIRDNNIKLNRVFVNGCTYLLYKSSEDLKYLDIPIIVSLNPIMIDGTGMCGVCRVTVNGEMKFACVDGPEFDGRLVDWNEFSKRRKQYMNEEAYLVHNSGCCGR
jgi:ferredoxin--NADP+ reductase